MDIEDSRDWQEELDRMLLEELGKNVSRKVLDHLTNPRNAGVMEDPDGEGTVTGVCEDNMRIQIRLNGEDILDIRFMTNGCGATLACGSMVTELAKHKPIQEAMKIDGVRILEALEGLPVQYTHCAFLAANALKAALRDTLEKRREPWKRTYRPK